VARLRKRIDEPFARHLLKTIRGVGFCISETDT
jgi:DNA-binding response OmpR family regulator